MIDTANEILSKKQNTLTSKKFKNIKSEKLTPGQTRAEKAVGEIYEMAGFAKPKVLWCASPKDALQQTLPKTIKNRVISSIFDIILSNIIVGLFLVSIVMAYWSMTAAPKIEGLIKAEILLLISQMLVISVITISNKILKKADSLESEKTKNHNLLGNLHFGDKEMVILPEYNDPIDAIIITAAKEYFQDRFSGVWMAPKKEQNEGMRKKAFEQIALVSGPWIATEKVAYLTELPIQKNFDNDGSFGALNKPALSYKDNWNIYYYKGKTLTGIKNTVFLKNAIEIKFIDLTKNLKEKREMLERFGFENYVQATGIILSANEYGTLWKTNDTNKYFKLLKNHLEKEWYIVPSHTINATQAAVLVEQKQLGNAIKKD